MSSSILTVSGFESLKDRGKLAQTFDDYIYPLLFHQFKPREVDRDTHGIGPGCLACDDILVTVPHHDSLGWVNAYLSKALLKLRWMGLHGEINGSTDNRLEVVVKPLQPESGVSGFWRVRCTNAHWNPPSLNPVKHVYATIHEST